MTQQTKQDVFPPTMSTWIALRMGDGVEGRNEVNRHIMAVYDWPLRVYFMGTSERWLGEPEDVVSGFFADRLGRSEFLHEWRASGMRLRRWLMNAFCFYLMELRRARARDRRAGELDREPIVFNGSPEAAIDRAFRVSLVREALRVAQETCEETGLGEHWNIFVSHYLTGRDYSDLSREFLVSPERAAVMARTAARKFRGAVRELLAGDGTPDQEVDQEILALIEEPTS